jgi:hypothetical protein
MRVLRPQSTGWSTQDYRLILAASVDADVVTGHVMLQQQDTIARSWVVSSTYS